MMKVEQNRASLDDLRVCSFKVGNVSGQYGLKEDKM